MALAKNTNRYNLDVVQRHHDIEAMQQEHKMQQHLKSVRKFHEKLILRDELLSYTQDTIRQENEARLKRH